jgi:hypothetical protein
MDPVVFLEISAIERETSGLLHLADDPPYRQRFHLMPGSQTSSLVEPPWLDVEKAVLIAVNRDLGDDVAIALDYREDPEEWRRAIGWRMAGALRGEIARSFSAFAQALRVSGAC